MMHLESAGQATAAALSARPADTAGPLRRYRIDAAHLFLANPFQDAASDGPIQQAVQNVLQALRWDPIDGRLVTLFPDGTLNRPAAQAPDKHPVDTALDLTLTKGAAEWLEGRDTAGLHLLQLGACVAAGLEPEQAMSRSLAVLQAYKAHGGQGVFVGAEGFFWRLSTHFALPARIRLDRGEDPTLAWHAEGGEYLRTRDGRGEGLWLRRRADRPDLARENRRPADRFDPRPAWRFRPVGDVNCVFDLSGKQVKVPFRRFVARLGRLRPWPPKGPERLAAAPEIAGPAPAASRLAAWYAPCEGDLVMNWQLSPPLD